MKPENLHIIGDAAILQQPKIALFCSVKCPGRIILQTYDLAKRFREEGKLVISGFHSPMEQECLRILLRAPRPVIWCLARGLYKKLPMYPVDCRTAVEAGQLVIVSAFPEKVRYVTAKTAVARNQLVAALAESVVVAYAASGGKTEALCKEVVASGKQLFTFEHADNQGLFAMGAVAAYGGGVLEG